jgi:DNA-binding MarR family transcriptional regulator
MKTVGATASGSSTEVLAGDVWRRLLEFVFEQQRTRFESLRERGLSPGHFKALMALELDDPRPMGALAEQLACDASNATWLVDRLEERGLVERRPLPTDRRVKTVVLTKLGAKTKVELEAELFAPPPGLLSLDAASLKKLAAALEALPSETS